MGKLIYSNMPDKELAQYFLDRIEAQEKVIAKYKYALQVILERANKHGQWSAIIAIAKEALGE